MDMKVGVRTIAVLQEDLTKILMFQACLPIEFLDRIMQMEPGEEYDKACLEFGNDMLNQVIEKGQKFMLLRKEAHAQGRRYPEPGSQLD